MAKGVSPHWGLALLLGMLAAFAPLSIDMYLPALPAIARDLQASRANTELTLAAFFIGLAAAQLVWGPISDRVGRRRPVLWGLGLYVLASIGCALARDVYALMGLRILQACGGAAGIVVARALVRDLYSGRDIAKMLSMQMLVMGAAPMLAPLLGSAVLGVAGWRAVFAVLAGIGSTCAVVVWRYLPETHQAATDQFERPSVWTHFRALLADRQYVRYALASSLVSAGLFAYVTSSSFIFVNGHHLAPAAFAVLFGTNAAGMIAVSQLNIRWLAAHPPARLLRRAMLAYTTAGAAICAAAWLRPESVALLAAATFAMLAPIGAVGSNAAALALEHHRERAGQASALMGTLQFTLSAAVSAIVGAASDGTARALGIAVLTCGLLALLTAGSPRQA
ncbi:MAG: multidrug effflux MFS transporter [Myxococcales bacterium]|nr:multidrug effflux MFS transporter [Myxococcales bacterium]